MLGTVLAVLSLVMASPGATRAEPFAGSGMERQLFAEVYRNIVEYHIDPARPDRLSIAGLMALSGIDPTLFISAGDGLLTLRQGNRQQRFAAPPAIDSEGWGSLTGAVLDAARAASPKVAAVPTDELEERVIDAALATLDRFSRYVRPALARQRRANRDGFDGIGIMVEVRNAEASITAVEPGTPAAAAGLRVADRILSVDGVASAALSPDQLLARLRGRPRTLVSLEVTRGDAPEPLHFLVPRAHIVEPTAKLQMRDGLAWIKISSFNQDTAAETGRLLRQAHHEMGAGLHGIVLDLRGNPGGLLDQAIGVASLFVSGVPVASTIGRLPESFQNFTAPGNAANVEALPLAVLVNGGSASAAEVVASALQDLHRAVVIGSASFGKGTVQTVIRTINDGELTVTWAQILTPLDYRLNRHGVVPNICTDGAADSTAAVSGLLQRVPARLNEPRKPLNDAGWLRLRALCPPQTTAHTVDAAVAEGVLGNPGLYARLLDRPPSAARTAEAQVTR